MTPEEIAQFADILDERAAKREETARTQRQPPGLWARYGTIVKAIGGSVAILAVLWAFVGDYVVMPRKTGDEAHRKLDTRVDNTTNELANAVSKQAERDKSQTEAIKHNQRVILVVHQNVMALGRAEGVRMKPAPQPEVLPE